jgi:hypothetical protein
MSGGWFWTLSEDAQNLPKNSEGAEDAQHFDSEHLRQTSKKELEDAPEEAHIQNLEHLQHLRSPSRPFEEIGDSFIESEI